MLKGIQFLAVAHSFIGVVDVVEQQDDGVPIGIIQRRGGGGRRRILLRAMREELRQQGFLCQRDVR